MVLTGFKVGDLQVMSTCWRLLRMTTRTMETTTMLVGVSRGFQLLCGKDGMLRTSRRAGIHWRAQACGRRGSAASRSWGGGG